MKKLLVIIIIVISIIIGAAIALPIIFKDSILEKVKTLINNNVSAKIEFTDFNLSFFRSFPKVQAELSNFTLIGLSDFKGDTIAAIGSLSTDISLKDLFSDDGLEISLIKLDNAQVNLNVNKNGIANWNIIPTSNEETTTTSNDAETSINTSIALNSVEINNLNLKYSDETMPMFLELDNINLDISGSLKEMTTTFNIDGKVSELHVDYDSVSYISNVALALNSKLIADMDKMEFTFGESQFRLNELPIALSGSFAMPSDSMVFDVNMQVPESNFSTLLALVPPNYKHYLNDVKAIGDAGLDGYIKGYMYDEEYPAMNFNVYVKDASMQYANMPEKVEKINLAMNVSQPQGKLDNLVVNISKAHAEVKNNPIDAQLLLKTPMIDMSFDARVSADLDFATLKKAIPMDSVDLRGEMAGNIALKGNMSAVEDEDYEKIEANGKINFSNFIFQSSELTKPVELTAGTIGISSHSIEFKSFAAKISHSDFTLNGYLSNYLGYLFQKQTIKGKFSLNSNLVDFNELITLIPKSNQEDVSSISANEINSDSILIFQVPEKLNLAFNSQINKAVFAEMNISDINGLITVADQKLWLKNLSMNMLDGSMKVDGSYAAYNPKEANFDFNFNVKHFTIPAAYQSFEAFRHYAPIAKNSTGELSADLKLAGKLDEKLSLITKSLNGSGNLSTQNVQLAKTETIEKLNLVFKTEKLNNLYIDDFSAKFKITDGNILVKPFKTKIAGQEAKVEGEILVNQTMNLNLDFNIHKADLNNDISKVLNVIPGTNKLDSYPIGLDIKGEIKDPSVTPDLTEAKDLIATELKKSAKENAGKIVDDVSDALKGLFGK
ncbi:MAG: AsmA-like C-terminal region-containing protein [Mangrovibacterium sp.]